MIVEIPIEFYRQFKENPERAMLEYLSIPVGATNPYFRSPEHIQVAIKKGAHIPLAIDEETYALNPDFRASGVTPRFMHIDLAIRRDAVGMSMCHAVGYTKRQMRMPGEEEYREINIPKIQFDFVSRIKPRAQYDEREMSFNALMSIIEQLVYEREFNLQDGLITFDRFQSHQMISNIRAMGIPCGLLSVDHTSNKVVIDFSKPEMIRKETISREPSAAMGALRDALHESRVVLPQMTFFDESRTWIEKEMDEAQFDGQKGKVVKMEGGSDDILQSAAGALFNCMNNASEMVDPEELSPIDQQSEDEFYGNLGLDSIADSDNEDGFVEDSFGIEDESDLSQTMSLEDFLGR